MKKKQKSDPKTLKTGKKEQSDQMLQKQLVSQVMRLFLVFVITLIVVSGVFMYFSNRNTLHEMTNVALNSTIETHLF